MARSLRDELLKAGLVTREQAARAERGSRPASKQPARGKAGGRARSNRRREQAADHPSKRASGASPKPPSPAPPPPPPAPPPAPDREERIRRLNLEIRRILDTEAENPAADTDVPFHFARGERLRRLYVSEDQRRRLAGGELAIVGFRGRHHLVPRRAGERVRELRPEVFVFIAGDDTGPEVMEEGYEGYEIPDDLVW